MKRTLKIIVFSLTILVLAAWLGLRFYLRSSAVARQVAEKIAAIYGGPVRLDSVDIGLMSSTIRGLQFYEPGDGAAATTPWLKVQSVTADIFLWHLVRGNKAPRRVHVHGADIHLVFDDAGKLLTRLPSHGQSAGRSLTEDLQNEAQVLPWDVIPPVTIEGTQVTVQRNGRRGVTAKNINARMDKEAGRLFLEGAAETELGNLALAASLERISLLARARIRTDGGVHFAPGFLERVPLVPTAILHELQVIGGEASGVLSATYDLTNNTFHYEGELAAKHLDFYLPTVAVAIQHGNSNVTIKDNLVQVRAASGQMLGGTVYAQGDVDFRGSVSRATLPYLKAENLNASEVPESWGIPAAVRKSFANGKLFGTAKLHVTSGGAGPTPASAATLAARVASDCVAGQWLGNACLIAAWPAGGVRIESQGKGEIRDPAGKSEPIEFDWQLAPPFVGPPKMRRDPGDLDGLFTTLILFDAETQPEPETPANDSVLKFNLKNASLAELVKNEGLKLPFPLDGKISFQLRASAPVNRIKDLKLLKAQGSAQIDRLVLAGLKLDKLVTDFQMDAGLLSFKTLKTDFADNTGKPGATGTLSGRGKVQLVPLGDLSAEFDLDKIPVHTLAEQSPDQVQGTVSGMLRVAGRADEPNIKKFNLDAKLTGDRLSLYDVKVDELALSVKLANGAVSFPDLQARVEGEWIKPIASVQVHDDLSFRASVALRDWDLRALQKLAAAKKLPAPAVSGTVNAEAIVQGKLKPFEVAITAALQAPSLKLDTVAVSDLRIRAELEKQTLKVNELSATLYDGKATGSAMLPLDGKTPGTVDFQLQNLNLRGLARDLRMPVAVDGHVGGTLKGTLPPLAKGKEGMAEFHVDFKAPLLRVQNIPTEQLQGVVQYQAGNLDYNLTGKTLGGSFDLEGRVPVEKKSAKAQDEKAREGRFRLRDVRVGQMVNALGGMTEQRLRGTLNVDVRFVHDAANFFPHGKGTLQIANVQWGDSILSENIQGEIVLADDQVRLGNLSGDLGEGTLDGQVVYDLKEPERSRFTLNLDAVESGRLVAPFLEKKIEGPIQARFRGKLGRVWSGSGDIGLAHGKVYGLEISELRVPVTWRYSLSQNRLEMDIPEISSQVARGRATGKMSFSWDHGGRTEGFVRLDRVELGDLLRQTIGHADLGAGRTTARFEFKGSDVRSLKDINGALVASFEQTQALQVPVLQQIAPYLKLGASTTFQKGNLIARLDRGTARVEQLALQGNNVQVFVAGTVTLEQQLNFHVVAKSGNVGWPTVQLGPIGVRVPVAGPVPLVLLQEASAVLSNHVAYLDVTGTPSSPVIRPRPVAILSGEAVRFFLNMPSLPITLNP